ncbi:D-alanyl-D-alanine endopeptidase (penicillin-binding protein 7) [Acinetobacter marinus]|uniref:D-alanyl-D-alanine endopeptidase (Penicillin-binding protein 7) n=2 Tax=Acinetobacter marinus TaxID=281375 RepID=A0A1G6HEK9_9GAMM|nr:D-alanyl-D-alanine endopeptidase (penicillin-binding protein 7) [Acinetobacter marinus]
MRRTHSKTRQAMTRLTLALATMVSCHYSFAEIYMQQNPSSNANIAWSDSQASQFLSNDEPAAQVTTQVTRSQPQVRKSSTIVLNNSTLANKYPTSTSNYSNASYSSYSSSQPSVNAKAALVMDAQTGEVLYGKNANTARSIASITKLMTAVVISDARLDMSEKITLQPIDFAGAAGKNSSSTLRAGDTLNRAEALLFALMKSENPAAAALGRTYPGGKSAFVAAMNAKARELGMHSSHFSEATGLDPSNQASARDLGILVSAASQYGLIRQFSTTPHYDFNLGYRVLKSNNTNALVRNGTWNINISKTGFINEAGRCVVMHTTVNQRPAIVVLLGASSSSARTNDANKLLTWVSHLPKRI